MALLDCTGFGMKIPLVEKGHHAFGDTLIICTAAPWHFSKFSDERRGTHCELAVLRSLATPRYYQWHFLTEYSSVQVCLEVCMSNRPDGMGLFVQTDKLPVRFDYYPLTSCDVRRAIREVKENGHLILNGQEEPLTFWSDPDICPMREGLLDLDPDITHRKKFTPHSNVHLARKAFFDGTH